MTTVASVVRDPAGATVAGAVVRVTVVAGPVLPGFTAAATIGGQHVVKTGETGAWSPPS